MADQQPLPEVPLLYTNAVRLGIGFTEIKLFFGEVVLPPPPADLQNGQAVPVGPGARQVDRLCVAIAPDIVPSLIDGLQKAVKMYETQFGALRKPPNTPQQQPAPKQ
jgi:hypothetical protein